MSAFEGTQTSPLRCSPHIQSLLKRLHKQSSIQEDGIPVSVQQPIRQQFKTDPSGAAKALDELMVDKFIALEEDKALFVYSLLLAIKATTVVEAGTSFGVSTIYWALAVGQNTSKAGEKAKGVVIGTEKEETKAQIAKEYWNEAGPEIEECIRLRVGDLNKTLVGGLDLEEGQQVDALVLDSKYSEPTWWVVNGWDVYSLALCCFAGAQSGDSEASTWSCSHHW